MFSSIRKQLTKREELRCTKWREKNNSMKSQLVQDFNKEIAKYNLGPLWELFYPMHKQPTPQAAAYLWKWETLHTKLMEAREIFTPERGGERLAGICKTPVQHRLTVGLGFHHAYPVGSPYDLSSRGNRPFPPPYAKCPALHHQRQRAYSIVQGASGFSWE